MTTDLQDEIDYLDQILNYDNLTCELNTEGKVFLKLVIKMYANEKISTAKLMQEFVKFVPDYDKIEENGGPQMPESFKCAINDNCDEDLGNEDNSENNSNEDNSENNSNDEGNTNDHSEIDLAGFADEDDNTTPNGIRIIGPEGGIDSGYSVANIGDWNNDGYDDFAVGAPKYAGKNGEQEYDGAVFVVFGSQEPVEIDLAEFMTVDYELKNPVDYIQNYDNNTDKFIVIAGSYYNQEFGHSVAAAGDFNGDGIPDLLVGDPGARGPANDYNQDNDGEAYIILGRENPSSFYMDDANDCEYSDGVTVCTNNLEDVIVVKSNSADKTGKLGFSVAGIGDFNGDGKDDIAIGAPEATTPADNSAAGKVYIIYGFNEEDVIPSEINLSDIGTTNIGIEFNGHYASRDIGYSLSPAGDFNNDGKKDVLIGIPSYDTDGIYEHEGGVYILYGRDDVNTVKTINFRESERDQDTNLYPVDDNNGVFISGGKKHDLTVFSLALAKDINGDQIDDAIIGAYSASFDELDSAGKVYIIYGKDDSDGYTIDLANGLTPSQGIVIKGIVNEGNFGTSVAYIGDSDGDGNPEILVGASAADTDTTGGEENQGMAYLINIVDDAITSGEINLNNFSGQTIKGTGSHSFTGWSVGGGGDFDNNGAPDAIIGAYAYGETLESNKGVSYVLLGENLAK